MTLPAATADLKDWITDPRKFVSIQYDDWSQVISDFRDSVKHTGQRKLASHVVPITAQIQSLLSKLITPVDPAPVISPVASCLQTLMPHSLANRIALPVDSLLQKLVWRSAANDETRQDTMNQGVRSQILRHVEHLERELVSDVAIIAAWRDLVFSADKVKRTVEEVAFRRDTLYAIAQRRNLYVTGPFSLFDDLRRVVSDVADAVQEELDNEAGHEHVPIFPPPGTPSGQPTWRRQSLLRANSHSRAPSRKLHCLAPAGSRFVAAAGSYTRASDAL